MRTADLAADRDIDFANVALSYGGFRQLAINPRLSAHGRIGFPDTYREGHEHEIFRVICGKLPQLARQRQAILDIGPGCANLPRLLIALCEQQAHRLYLLDSPEMLGKLPDAACVDKISGAFPGCMAAAEGIGAQQFDAILCYSVLHYLFLDANPFQVVDTVVQALAPGGSALFSDIPNLSKRKRFFSSMLLGMMRRAQLAGCDAYLVPQAENLPMANRRDDLIIRKP